MSALTTNRKTRERIPSARQFEAAGTIYAGALVAVNSNGKAVPASDASGLTVVGVALNQTSSGGTVTVKNGCFLLKNSTGAGALALADAGSRCYVGDDQTVSKSAGTNGVIAGAVYDVETKGVWVIVGGRKLTLADISDVSDLADDYAAADHDHNAAYMAAPEVVSADPAAAAAANKGKLIIVGTGWTGGTAIATGVANEVYISTGAAWVKLG